jgi:MerR family transcriptional regulator, copper efflux regulator
MKISEMTSGLTTGQLAKRVGVNVETVRYYERLHLLSATTRKASGYRVCGPGELRRLHFIRNAQALGFTLQEIAEFLNLRVASTGRCGEVKRKTQDKLSQVEKKIAHLKALARSLRQLLECCDAQQLTEHCPIVDRLEDQAGCTSKDTAKRKHVKKQ